MHTNSSDEFNVNRPRLAVVFTEGELEKNPPIVSLLQCLVPHFAVDLLTEYPAEVNLEGVVNHYAHQRGANKELQPVPRVELKQWLKRVPSVYRLLFRMRQFYRQIRNKGVGTQATGQLYRYAHGTPEWGTPGFVNMVARHCKAKLCDCVIAVKARELIICHQVTTEVPIVYYSLELFHRGHPDFPPAHLAPLKDAEARAFREVAAVIIQDEERARFLWQDNQHPYEAEKVILFPVSYMGYASLNRSDYFRLLYPELARQKLVVQMGSIHKYRRSDELIKIAAACPEQYAMIFHGFADGFAYKALGSGRLPHCRLSKPVQSYWDIEKVAAGADIGLVFYLDNNFNEHLIAHASAQFALFMKCGVPVLASNIGCLARIVRLYNCGIVVEDLANLFHFADKIMADYETYSHNAVRCFESEYQLGHYCEPLVDRLREICKRSQRK